MTIYEVILKPIVTEKGVDKKDTERTLCFKVHAEANKTMIKQAVETASGRGIPPWLELNSEQFRGTVTDLPKREDIRLPIQEQLIVELYSK